MSAQILTQERLKELLSYDPETGVFTRIVSTSSNAKAGQVAGSVNKISGYREIRVDDTLYYGHRLAWLYVYGSWPEHQVDHANRIRSDNRICNLRSASSLENSQNQRLRSTNTSGLKGVTWHKAGKKWAAQIVFKGKNHHLGLFDDASVAHQHYLDAKAKLHTFHPTAL